MKAAAGLTNEEGLKHGLANGYVLEVVCLEEPERRHNTWSAVWNIRVVSQDGTVESVLTTEREFRKARVAADAKKRDFKTAVGLISFLADLGLPAVSIPIVVGGRARNLPGPQQLERDGEN